MYRHGMWMDTSACIHVCKDGMRGLSALCVYVCAPSDTEVQMGIMCEYVCNSIYTCLYRDGAVLFMDACVFILVGTHMTVGGTAATPQLMCMYMHVGTCTPIDVEMGLGWTSMFFCFLFVFWQVCLYRHV